MSEDDIYGNLIRIARGIPSAEELVYALNIETNSVLYDALRDMESICDRYNAHSLWLFGNISCVIDPSLQIDHAFDSELREVLESKNRLDVYKILVNSAYFKMLQGNEFLGIDPFDKIIQAITEGIGGIYYENGVVYSNFGSMQFIRT